MSTPISQITATEFSAQSAIVIEQQNLAQIISTEVAVAQDLSAVEIPAASPAIATEIVIPGLQGIPGNSAPTYSIRIDASTANVIYTGRALAGTAESATSWIIKRRAFSTAGVLTGTGTATGAWSNRANLAYT